MTLLLINNLIKVLGLQISFFSTETYFFLAVFQYSCAWTLVQCKHNNVLFMGNALMIIRKTVASDPADLGNYTEILASTWWTATDNLKCCDKYSKKSIRKK